MSFINTSISSVLVIALNLVIIFLGLNNVNPYGLVLIIPGLIIYFYNLHLMGDHWSLKVEIKDKLVKKGSFKYVRHPLYLGLCIACVGLLISMFSMLLLFTFVFVNVPFMYARALNEESLLKKDLPGYRKYMSQTGMFLPRVKVKLK
jgi:protein-S-isoprenylcysteine O-methyltransferase Ste14